MARGLHDCGDTRRLGGGALAADRMGVPCLTAVFGTFSREIMAFDPATLLSRTLAGDAELSTARNGLSLGQRKLLTFLDQPQALEELIAKRTLEPAKLARDLVKLAALDLVAIDGQHAAPAAASVVIGGARTRSMLRWLVPPLLLVGAAFVYFAMSAPPPRKVDATPLRLSAAPLVDATPVPQSMTPAFGAVDAMGPIASAVRDVNPPAGVTPARPPAEMPAAASNAQKALPPDAFKSTATHELSMATTVPQAASASAGQTRTDAGVAAESGNARVPHGTGVAKSDHVMPGGFGAPTRTTPATPSSNAAGGTPSAVAPSPPTPVPAPVTPITAAASPAFVAAATVPARAQAAAAVAAPAPPATTAPAKLAMAAPSAAVAHPPAAAKLVPLTREDPEFPREARARGVSAGAVKARLAIDAGGKVTAVAIVDARPPRVFDRAVTQALSRWTFPAGDAGRSTDVDVAFHLD
jgi:TonB family protein